MGICNLCRLIFQPTARDLPTVMPTRYEEYSQPQPSFFSCKDNSHALKMTISESSIDQVLIYLLKAFSTYQQTHRNLSGQAPFVVGLTGLQGSGKSTWTEALAATLKGKHGLKVVQVSLDDFYHDHTNLVRIREADSSNPLLQTRGQPGTHDKDLAVQFFSELSLGEGVHIPVFDKSKFDGEGDRVPKEEWDYVSPNPPIDIVIFEGWCVGFRALDTEEVKEKWVNAKKEHASNSKSEFPTETLADLELQHLLQVNSYLESYNDLFMASKNFNFFIHLDTKDLQNVYRWRLGQEHHLWRLKGQGMTDEAVVSFVKGYMPSYELYLDRLRSERFIKDEGEDAHLRVILDKNRNVEKVVVVGF